MASNIDYAEADYVVTMETKGIPMALMTAKAMNLPLVIIRKDIKVSEGPTLSMTYVCLLYTSLRCFISSCAILL